ncbi:MAG: ParB/RepB/Spo0J family partition protein [Pseudomonadota bacterium]
MAKKGLGRGLEAILGDAPAPERTGSPQELPLSDIAPDKDQPRKSFAPEEIKALADSISTRGVLQPILVRPGTPSGSYVIIAGERRWRAAQKAGLQTIPVLIKDVAENVSAEMALIENVQRVDLNPIEEADAYQRLSDVHGRTQSEIAAAVGKSRSHVANMLRLTALPDDVRAMVVAGDLSMGHARALLSAENPLALAKDVVARDLSVRETERLVSAETMKDDVEKVAKAVERNVKDADTRALEQDLRETLGIDVDISRKGKSGAGRVTLSYQNLDQLDEICRKLMGSTI